MCPRRSVCPSAVELPRPGTASEHPDGLGLLCGERLGFYRAVIVRMRFHQPTRDDVARRTADGRTKREIIRCLKRFLAREIYQRVMTDFRTRQAVTQAA